MGRKRHIDGSEHFAKMTRQVMDSAAYKALSCPAKALIPRLKLEWKGPRANNNGKIMFSVRQAADALGVSPDTAAKAFYDLQTKGFIVVTEIGHPGLAGYARGHQYEITELALPNQPSPRNSYRDWRPGRDFDVQKATAHNPKGYNGSAPKTRTGSGGSTVQVNRANLSMSTQKTG